MMRRIREGELLPRGYGVAWYDALHRMNVCYPIPLNLLVGLARRIWWNLAAPPKGPVCEELREEIENLRRRVDGLRGALANREAMTERIVRRAAATIRGRR